jgi:xanthine dehydrogenase large subunit
VYWTEVVHRAYLERVSLSATGYHRTPGLHFDRETGRGHPFRYFAWGAAVSEVEVDGFTGEWRLRRVDIVHDCGDPLNPLVDRGQVEGGFTQGLGWVTMEELVWDEQGRLRTFAPSTYKIPTAHDVPEAFHVRLLERAAEPGAVYGSKAVGEPPFMLAVSVREAIRDAVSAFATEPGPVPLASPATPERILDAIDAVRAPRESAEPPVPAD